MAAARVVRGRGTVMAAPGMVSAPRASLSGSVAAVPASRSAAVASCPTVASASTMSASSAVASAMTAATPLCGVRRSCKGRYGTNYAGDQQASHHGCISRLSGSMCLTSVETLLRRDPSTPNAMKQNARCGLPLR